MNVERTVRPRDFRKAIHPERGEKSLTKTDTGVETDINAIVSKFQRTGRFDHLNPMQPRYGDFSAVTDLQTAMLTVDQAWLEFEALPPSVRNAAHGDPKRLLSMLTTEEGCRALEAAGLEFATPQAPSVPSSPQSEATEGSAPTERSEEPLGPSRPSEPLSGTSSARE